MQYSDKKASFSPLAVQLHWIMASVDVDISPSLRSIHSQTPESRHDTPPSVCPAPRPCHIHAPTQAHLQQEQTGSSLPLETDSSPLCLFRPTFSPPTSTLLLLPSCISPPTSPLLLLPSRFSPPTSPLGAVMALDLEVEGCWCWCWCWCWCRGRSVEGLKGSG